MKNFKKLSILLLSLVMVFSCLAVFASADEASDAEKIAGIKRLVEYYDEDGIYVCDGFDGLGGDGALDFDENSLGEYVTAGEKTVWGAALDGKGVLFTPDIIIPDDARSVAFVFSFCMNAEAENEDKGYLAIELSGDSLTENLADGQAMLVFDYNEEKAYLAGLNVAELVSPLEIEGFKPENGAWYTVEVIYNKKANTLEGKIVAEDASYSFSYKLSTMASLSMVTVRARNLGNAGVTAMLDSLEVYEGTFIRSNLPGARQAYLDEALLEIMKLYREDGTAAEVKDAVIETVDALLAEGYLPAEGSATAAYYNDYFVTELSEYHWSRFYAMIGAIDKDADYQDRMDHIEATLVNGAIPARPFGVSEQIYNAAVGAYNDEIAALAKIAEYGDVLLLAATEDVENYDYAELLDWILAFEAARENLLKADGSYDDSYKGLHLVIEKIYDPSIDRFVSLKKMALGFIAAVDGMNEAYVKNFGDRFAAYSVANAYVNDPAFVFIRDSFISSLSFVDADTFVFDGREYKLEGVSANGKSATAEINYMPYTLKLSNYTLTLEGEGFVLVFEPVGSTGGTSFTGSWQLAQTVADAYAKFDLRDDAIIAGSDACKAIISDIKTALLAKGYDIRVAKRDGVLEKYADEFAWYEEGGKYFGYEGLADALASFDAFCDAIATDKVNADKYIAAVIKLRDAKTYAEWKVIIDEATPLEKLGNVDGYANELASVKQINMLFDEYKQIVVEAEGNALQFVTEVNAIAAYEALADRLVHIRAAEKLLKAGLVDEATGVLDAKAALAGAKEAYLAEANAMNESVKEQGTKLAGVAFAPLKLGVPEKVVFIIKKVFEL